MMQKISASRLQLGNFSLDQSKFPVKCSQLLMAQLLNFENVRKHQICLSYTDSDNVILQQETQTTHVSLFQLLLSSQPFGLRLFVELLTSGVEHSADINADASDVAFDAYEDLFLSGFPVRRVRHNSSHSTTQFDERSSFALHDSREHPSFYRIFRSRHVGCLCSWSRRTTRCAMCCIIHLFALREVFVMSFVCESEKREMNVCWYRCTMWRRDRHDGVPQ